MKTIYVAGPLFSVAEQRFNEELANIASHYGFNVILPQDMCKGITETQEIFRKCRDGVYAADIVIAVLDGADHDSGTCWEVGYAYALKKYIIGIRTDFRQSGDTLGFNAMLAHSADRLIINDTNYKVELERELTAKHMDHGSLRK